MAFQQSDDEPDRKQRGRPRKSLEKTEQSPIKSLDRALVVLTELTRHEGVRLSTIASALHESPATVYRVLITFAHHGIVEYDEGAQTWHIGAGAFLIGSAFLRRTSLIESSRPVLRNLMLKTGETANLGIERDKTVVFVSQVETSAPIRAFFPPGEMSPLHASGIGKVLLAHFSEDRLSDFVKQGLERFTPSTVTTLAGLRENLATIRAQGYALDDQEKNEGMRCIAAPIRNAHDEVVAGLSISGPTSRVKTERVGALADQVMAAAHAVSEALGYKAMAPCL